MPTLKRLTTTDTLLNKIQDNTESAIAPLLKDPSNFGNQLKKIQLIVDQDNIISHKLGKDYSGWIITNLDTNAVIWSVPTKSPSLNLVLRTSASCTVSIKVY